MPFIDANLHLPDSQAPYDHVVVGAGAAGILVSVGLAARGRRVLLVETGHFDHDESRQELNDIEETGKRFGNAKWTRKRALGGTTIAWGGQSLRFAPLDFEHRPWVEHSGWPIGLDELEPYYRSANSFMGIREPAHSMQDDPLLQPRGDAFCSDLIDHCYSLWAPQPNFLKLHRRALERGVTTLYNAHLTRIDLDDDRSVRAIELANFAGRRAVVGARSVVLATGGIESVRILLLNRHQQPGGLGAGGGWLGYGFMEHPCTTAGDIVTSDLHRLQAWLGNRWRRGGRMMFKMSAAREWQVRHRMLNASAGVSWVYPGGGGGPLSAARAVVRDRSAASLPEAVRGSAAILRGLASIARTGVVYKPGAVGRLGIVLEQPPARTNRISLAERCDTFGQPLARVHWRLDERSWRTACAFVSVLRGELGRLRLGELAPAADFDGNAQGWEDLFGDVNHHMGGARMSASPADGVVDRDLQVWGARNLHVCSCATFPTGSHSNPTLTMLALAARLVDRLAPG